MSPSLQHVLNGLKWFVPYVAYISALLSLVALFVVLLDRRPRLRLQAKKGDWVKASKATPAGWLIEGAIEAYNVSSRANTIREYKLYAKNDQGNWVPLECEQCTLTESRIGRTASTTPDTERTMNVTPLLVAPYSGVVVPIAAVAPEMKKPQEIRVETIDLFGKRYSVDISTSPHTASRASFQR